MGQTFCGKELYAGWKIKGNLTRPECRGNAQVAYGETPSANGFAGGEAVG